LAHLTGADLVAGGGLARINGRYQVRDATAWGTENGFDLPAHYVVDSEHDLVALSPLWQTYFQHSLQFLGTCKSRKDLLADREWMPTTYWRAIHRPMGIEHILICFLPTPGRPAEFNGLTLSRAKSVTRDFSLRDRALVQEAQARLTPLIGGPLAGF